MFAILVVLLAAIPFYFLFAPKPLPRTYKRPIPKATEQKYPLSGLPAPISVAESYPFEPQLQGEAHRHE